MNCWVTALLAEVTDYINAQLADNVSPPLSDTLDATNATLRGTREAEAPPLELGLTESFQETPAKAKTIVGVFSAT